MSVMSVMSAKWFWRVVVVAWSVLVWCALWSDFSIANVVWGAVIGAASLRLLPVHPGASEVTVRPLRLVAYLLYGAWSLVQSSAAVAWEVITPGHPVKQGIVEAPLRNRSRGVTTLIANTVSLTPGTLTLEVRREPPSLFVHVMQLGAPEDVRAEVRRLEDLALRAFPAVPTAADDTAADDTPEESP